MDLCARIGRVYRMKNGHTLRGHLRPEKAFYGELVSQVYSLVLKIHIHIAPIKLQRATHNTLLRRGRSKSCSIAVVDAPNRVVAVRIRYRSYIDRRNKLTALYVTGRCIIIIVTA